MKLSTQPYKGTRDFYPEDMRVRNWMFAVIRRVCESYGYEEYDAPVLEPVDLYLSKTSEEIVNEQSYSFTDRGDRKVIMRPEMTPSVSRMVAARRQELGYPLRLYNIANFFRYERPQKGRLREFWQLNADIFGVGGIEADVEIIKLADSIMKALDANPEMYEIRINSKLLLDKRIKESGPKMQLKQVMRLIDGFEKIDKAEFKNKLADAVERPEDLYEFLVYDGDTEEIKEIKNRCEKSGISVKSKYSLARGFDYYTDIVFEVFDKNPQNNRSLFGGGRYDGLVGNFGVEPVPTVGFGMGDVTLLNFLNSNNLVPKLGPATDVAMLLIGEVNEKAQPFADELRRLGINVAIDYEDRKIDKKIKSAVKNNIRFALFVGPDEISQGIFTLKDLESGKETKDNIENTAKTIRLSRN
ncbi:MAG TPA: histidine--tRNA ligase [Candidatus Saccharimonadales bacterium]|nr:histidine--tRNA ligase [Candidatus Saccharimonadales bacterium]